MPTSEANHCKWQSFVLGLGEKVVSVGCLGLCPIVRFGIAVLKVGFCCRGQILCAKSSKIVALGSLWHVFLFTLVVVQNVA